MGKGGGRKKSWFGLYEASGCWMLGADGGYVRYFGYKSARQAIGYYLDFFLYYMDSSF